MKFLCIYLGELCLLLTLLSGLYLQFSLERKAIFVWIAKQNPVYEMVPSVSLSVRLGQQFGLILAFKFIAE